MRELKNKVKSSPVLKKLAQFLLTPRNQYRPRWWIRTFVNPWFHKRGNNTVISRKARIDAMPFNHFTIGSNSFLEDQVVINNGVGPVVIGDRTLVGIATVIIGPVTLGNDILMAQNIVVSGLNHGYEDVLKPIKDQDCTTAHIEIEDEVWIGANAVITSGVRIGKHSIVAAGSIVTKDVPPYTIVAGNPARVIKHYDWQTGTWQKVSQSKKISV